MGNILYEATFLSCSYPSVTFIYEAIGGNKKAPLISNGAF